MQKPKPRRNPNEAVLSASVPRTLKRTVDGRAALVVRPTSALVKAGLEYLERTNWRDVVVNGVSIANLPPKALNRLKEWVDSGKELEEL